MPAPIKFLPVVSSPKKSAAKTVDRTCQNRCCKYGKKGKPKVFQARQADVNRGWAKFCCKRCKAQTQEARTGQYKRYLCNRINGYFGGGRDDEYDEFQTCGSVSFEDGPFGHGQS